MEKRKKQHLICEWTEFNNMRLNPDNAQLAMPNVSNPSLSIDAYDKHQNSIQAATSRINGLLHSLSNTPQFNILKSKLSLEDQNIKSLKVIRISKSNDVDYDIYISFIIDDAEYFGVVENILDPSPDFRSEVFKNADLVQSREWIIKIKGLVIKVLKKWLTPDEGEYQLIGDDVICTSVLSGKSMIISKGTKIIVVRSYDKKVVIKHEEDLYNLTGDSFVYFNYWFSKII